MRSKTFSKAALVLVFGLIPSARATLLFINNSGFEGPVTDFATVGSITGWDLAGSGAGVWNLTDTPTGFWSVEAPEGKQIAFVGRGDPGNPASISQVLTDTLLANTIYTLSGQVGHPAGFGSGQDPVTTYTVELLAGNNVLGSISGTGPELSFTPFQLTFDSAGSAFVGQALTIRLSSSQSQSGFDDIRLDASAVPEPSTWLLTAAGMLGLVRYRRLRRR